MTRNKLHKRILMILIVVGALTQLGILQVGDLKLTSGLGSTLSAFAPTDAVAVIKD